VASGTNLGPHLPEFDDEIESIADDTNEEERGPLNDWSSGGEDSNELEVARILLAASATKSV
jgi:hypothetical protein